MMDNIVRWNEGGVLRNLHEAELMTLWFPLIGKVLVMDLRHNEREGPFIALDRVIGARERVRYLERLRPHFPTPDNLTFAQWWRSARGLETTGALDDLRGRLERMAWPQASSQLDRAYRQLIKDERSEALGLITGDPEMTKTLWQR